MARVGVLALQGAYAAHRTPLEALGHEYVEVRSAAELHAGRLGGLVLPGGESTAILKLLDEELTAALQALHRDGRPVLGVCAGLILSAARVEGRTQRTLGWLDVSVARNAYGRQVHSFEATSEGGLPLVFIRAPRIADVGRAEVVDRLEGEPILVRQGAVLGASFHPELTPSLEVHRAAFGVA